MEAVIETQRTGKAERKKVSTKNILFIVSGAFAGLPDIIRRRLAKGTMGFRRGEELPVVNGEVLKRAITTDLVDYGFESEFVGRLPVIAQLGELNEEALFDILQSPHSAVIQGKKRDFAAYGIELNFDEDALREFAHRAYKAGIGARGLTSVIEKALIRFEKLLPSSSVKALTVTSDLINHSEAAAAEMLTRDAVTQFQRKFLEKSGLILEFPPDTYHWVRDHIDDAGHITEQLQKMFGNYEYGMKLANLQSLRVTPEILDNPEVYLDRMIKQVYAENPETRKG